MNYAAYIKRTQLAAKALGGEYISLAGGYYGVRLMADGTYLILALDFDSSNGWAAWTEDENGERCCDNNTIELGWLPTDQLKRRALAACAQHGRHRR